MQCRQGSLGPLWRNASKPNRPWACVQVQTCLKTEWMDTLDTHGYLCLANMYMYIYIYICYHNLAANIAVYLFLVVAVVVVLSCIIQCGLWFKRSPQCIHPMKGPIRLDKTLDKVSEERVGFRWKNPAGSLSLSLYDILNLSWISKWPYSKSSYVIQTIFSTF